jgi:uncharacterized protein
LEITNTFSVPLPVDTVWPALLDVQRIAPCLPGASVERIVGDDVHGSVRVKLGPISMRYRGVMTFTERDEAARRAVMSARAQEARGGGSVNAIITAGLVDNDGSTDVTVVTELDITGKPAQFGRGVIAGVSNQIMGQFANNLSRALQAEQMAAPMSAKPVPNYANGSGTASYAEMPAVPCPVATASGADEDVGLDALALIKEPAKRLLPPLVAGLLIGLVLGRLGRNRAEAPALAVIPLFGDWPSPQP